MELALLIGFIVTNGGWLVYLHKRDHLHRDQMSELTSRIAHPELLNPRVLERPSPVMPSPEVYEHEQGEIERVGSAFHDGVDERTRPKPEED